MKKIIMAIVAVMLAVSSAGCAANQTIGPDKTTAAETTTPEATNLTTATASETPSATEKPSPEDIVYEFEFTDIDGNVHKLSDYRGKPVYLRVWASWCSVCLSSLESLDKLAGEAKDFTVLSVVMPDLGGEKSAEDFTKWFKDFGYKNLPVLLDTNGQIVYDFGINAFPSQIMFDSEGHIAYGAVGLMETEQIKQVMAQIAAGKL